MKNSILNQVSRMEAETISKNAASLKSHTSRGKWNMLVIPAIWLLCILSAISVSAQSQGAKTQKPDIITLLTGDDVEAKVEKVSDNEVEYKKWSNKTGPTYTLKKSEIFRICYANGEKDVFFKIEEQAVAVPVPQHTNTPPSSTNATQETNTAQSINATTATVSNPGEPMRFEQVIDIPDLKKDEIYNKVNSWFVETFNSEEAGLQIQDKENGKMAGKCVFQDKWGFGHYYVRYAISIDIRDNKVKIAFNDPHSKKSTGAGYQIDRPYKPLKISKKELAKETSRLQTATNALMKYLQNNTNNSW